MTTTPTDNEKIRAEYEANFHRANKLIAIGLPGCLAMGMVPGSRPGLIRPADKYHKQLIEELLKRLPDEPAPPASEP